MNKKMKPDGYWKNWKNFESELKQVIEELGHFPTQKELQKMGKGSICHAISDYHGGYREVRRKLGQEPYRENKRENGFFDKLDNDDIIRYINDNYRGLKISELEREDASFVNVIRRRGLMDRLVEEGILMRVCKPTGFFSNMEDDEMINYVRDNYKGWTITPLEKESSALVNNLRNRGLAEGLFEEGTLIRKKPVVSPLRNLSDSEFIKYLEENYYGETRTQLAQENKSAYREIQRRNLADRLIKKGILINREKGLEKGFFAKMNDEELKSYLIENCNGVPLKDASLKCSRAYSLASKRGIIDELVAEGILIRKGNGYRNINGSETIDILRSYVSGGRDE